VQAYRVTTADGIDAIEQVVMDTPTPASDEILVKMKACSLNYRDMLITMGAYVRNDVRPIVPLSDGAGEVVRVGSEVAIFNLLRIQGIYVGSTAMLEQLVSTMEAHQIHPEIDKSFPFSKAIDAYHWMAQAKHFGKIVIESEG